MLHVATMFLLGSTKIAMKFAELSEFVGVILFLLFVIFQVGLPLWRNTPLFPMFRKNRRKLASDLRSTRGAVDDQQLERELNRTRSKVAPKSGSEGPKS